METRIRPLPRPVPATVDSEYRVDQSAEQVSTRGRDQGLYTAYGDPVRLAELFKGICKAHSRLRIYQEACREPLLFCFAVQLAIDSSGTQDEIFRPSVLCIGWFQQFLDHLVEWSSYQNIISLLIRRDRVKNVLEKIVTNVPEEITPYLRLLRGQHLLQLESISRFHAEETIEALKEILFSKEELKSALQLRGMDAQSFLDLIEEVMDTIDPKDKLYIQCFRVLRKFCAHSCILPTSCVLSAADLKKKSPEALASGGFADVWLGTYQGSHVALKVIRIYSTSDMSKVKKRFCREAVLWKRLSHRNIMPFLGASMTQSALCMVSEWMTNGNISMYLEQNPSVNRLELLLDVAQGLRYLHYIGVVHGDLKGANILIDDSLHARLSDFGLTAVCYGSNSANVITTSSTGDGSVRWMAPELISPEQDGSSTSRPSLQSDVYAMGMVIFEVFSGCIPFYELPLNVTVMLNVIRGSRPVRPSWTAALGLTDGVWGVVKACWQADRRKRPDILTVQRCLDDALHEFVPPAEEELVLSNPGDTGSDSDRSSGYDSFVAYWSFDSNE